ncbi:MAG: hypothetical protein ABI906_09125 [Pseudomonadota bacterium]
MNSGASYSRFLRSLHIRFIWAISRRASTISPGRRTDIPATSSDDATRCDSSPYATALEANNMSRQTAHRFQALAGRLICFLFPHAISTAPRRRGVRICPGLFAFAEIGGRNRPFINGHSVPNNFHALASGSLGLWPAAESGASAFAVWPGIRPLNAAWT